MTQEFEVGMVSIITPVYNAAKFLAETIQSVKAQTYHNWELILVDDASSDQSRAIIAAFQAKDARIRFISLVENSGAAVARNTGLAAARGQYVAFLDSDDAWLPEKLSQQLAFMQANAYVFTYTNLALVDETGGIIKESLPIPSQLDYQGLLKNTAIACSTVIIDQAAVGTFEMPLVRRGQDTATWLMLMRTRQIQAYGLNQVLNRYRQVNGSISSNKLTALKRTWHTYRHLEQLPLAKAIYYFCHYVIQAIIRRS